MRTSLDGDYGLNCAIAEGQAIGLKAMKITQI